MRRPPAIERGERSTSPGAGDAPSGPHRASAARSHRPQPSLEPLAQIEEADADQNDEEDRAVHSRNLEALREIGDELTEAAEIDQELDADDVDEGEDQAEPEAVADRRDRRREHD